jgi:hypothetical protein
VTISYEGWLIPSPADVDKMSPDQQRVQKYLREKVESTGSSYKGSKDPIQDLIDAHDALVAYVKRKNLEFA